MKHSWYTRHVYRTGSFSLEPPAHSYIQPMYVQPSLEHKRFLLYQTIILGILRRSYKTFAIEIIIGGGGGGERGGGSSRGMLGEEVPHPYRRMNFVSFIDSLYASVYGLTYTVFIQHICHASLLLTKFISISQFVAIAHM